MDATQIKALNKIIAADLDRAAEQKTARLEAEARCDDRANPPEGDADALIAALIQDKLDMRDSMEAARREISALRTALRRLGLRHR